MIPKRKTVSVPSAGIVYFLPMRREDLIPAFVAVSVPSAGIVYFLLFTWACDYTGACAFQSPQRGLFISYPS